MESKDNAKTSEPPTKTKAEITAEKHAKLIDEQRDEAQIVEQVKAKNVIPTPFINPAKSWDNTDDFTIPKDIQTNIIDNLKFLKPSVIQGVTIPMISAKPFHSLIAQAKNGSGKTGSFAIGSTLRVDRDLKAIQVVCMVNVRELCN